MIPITDDTTIERLLTPAEVAARFRVDPKTVTRWAVAGTLPSVRTPGGHRRFPESAIRAALTSGADGLDRIAIHVDATGKARLLHETCGWSIIVGCLPLGEIIDAAHAHLASDAASAGAAEVRALLEGGGR